MTPTATHLTSVVHFPRQSWAADLLTEETAKNGDPVSERAVQGRKYN